MFFKVVAWTLLAAVAFATVLLFNYWAAYQPLSTLLYAGIVLALCGLVNVVIPFRFLGVRKRAVGALICAGGVGLAAAGLLWPAPIYHVAQRRTQFDDVIPQYQFFEKHSTRVHAGREQLMQAVRESTFGDMKSLGALLRIRATALRIRDEGASLQGMRVLDAFAKSGYVSGGSDHEITMCGAVDVRAGRVAPLHTLQDCADYRGSSGFKMAFTFYVQDAGGGWSTLTTETRIVALDEATRRGIGRYWRFIVPGSGMLRRQWLDAIGKRAERLPTAAL